MYKTERQFTTRASEYTIEEVYTNLDIPENEQYIPSEGYAFRYPQRWLNDPSQKKVVGIRRLRITPPRHITAYGLEIEKYEGTSTNVIEEEFIFSGKLDVLPENQLLEMLFKMRQDILDASTKKYPNGDHIYLLQYSYENAELKFEIIDFAHADRLLKFRIVDGNGEFLKFLNQSINETFDEIMKFKYEHVFKNVWDRGYIEFHASFSESKRQFIGINDEFYQKPSLFFKSPHDGSVFYIRFTTDGKTPILPRYCRFIIQLCFVINYNKAIIK